ncbi:glycosyltransferase family 4 protein [Oceanicella sp. SM1341]|uniref:glycosyltransferase family 4 protein n=1 Tax=Oceanicella sp. SM1341 TaxID=1548889 RepID=UPI000E513C54|nr:glycosyltransferase family 4 protein [Oceanicella sp. SM1341]
MEQSSTERASTERASKVRASSAQPAPGARGGADHAPAFTVLQLVPALNEGGVERGAVEISAAITAAGGRALLASAGGRLEPALRRAGGELIRRPGFDAKNPFKLPDFIRAIREIILAEKVDIVHARSRAPAWAGWFAARAEHRPFVTTYHGSYSEGFPGKRLYNSVMAKGRPVIAVSEFIAARVMEKHGLAREDIVVIPRGADLSVFDERLVTPERTAAIAQDWELTEDPRPIVLLPGRLTRWKGQGLLVEAAALMAQDGPLPFRIVLAGGDPYGAFGREIEERARAAGLSGDVSLVGSVTDMPAALALSAVVVCPSLEPEAFGRAVVEAQAMSRPVIAADHGGARETVAPGVSGWLVRPGDAGALAQALREALALGPDARAAMGAAGLARVRAQYSIAAMQAATLDVYAKLLARR